MANYEGSGILPVPKKAPTPPKPKAPKPKPKNPTYPTGNYSTSGGGGGGSAPAAKSGLPTLPTQPKGDIYADIQKRMEQLYGDYGNLRMDYDPRYFQFEDWNPGDEYENKAKERIGYELAARQPIWQQQAGQVSSAYEDAIRKATAEQQMQTQGIERSADAEYGRLANMMANSGLGAGQGALQEQFGVNQAFANQTNDVATRYGLERAQAAAERANQLSGIAAEQASFKGAMPGQIMDMADQLAAAGYNQYTNERGFQSGLFDTNEARRYQSYMDTYQAAQNAMNAKLGILGSMGDYRQDTRNYNSQEAWNRYNAQYNAYADNQNLGYARDKDAIAQGNWNQQFNYNAAQEKLMWDYYNNKLAGISGGSYGNVDMYGNPIK